MSLLGHFIDAKGHVVQALENAHQADRQAREGDANHHLVSGLLQISRIIRT